MSHRARFFCTAFTLVEVMLGSALGLLLLVVMVLTLVPLMRYGSWASGRATVVQAAMLVGERLGGDLQRAPLTGISLPTDQEPGLLAIHGVVGVTDSAAAAWDQSVILYRWDASQGSLLRVVWAGPPGANLAGAPLRLSVNEIRNALAQPALSRRSLVQGLLTEFRLSPSLTSDSLPLILHMVTQISVPGRPAERFEVTREMALRSGAP